MRLSEAFTKTSKTVPADERATNARLLLQGGFISKSSAGVYTLLPFGLRVLGRINAIIREEMNALGAEEMLMPALVEKRYWDQSKRWESDVAFRTGLKTATMQHSGEFEYGLGWTHEEVTTAIASGFISSYRDLPRAVYQIQTKFRAELRAQGGLLRGREFQMKDLYSFHENEEDLGRFYEQARGAYDAVFKRVGLEAIYTEASGGAFTEEYTHEFQVMSDAGEDIIYCCGTCSFSQNKEIYKPEHHTGCGGRVEEIRSIEVGNIFKLGTRYSEAFGLQYTDREGRQHPVVMGSYGIGPTRTLATIVEVHHDNRGIVWPISVAPFDAHLIYIKSTTSEIKSKADELYQTLQSEGISVLYDDRGELSVGEKFADADLIGIPYRLLMSEKTAGKVELKRRDETEAKLLTAKEVIKKLIG